MKERLKAFIFLFLVLIFLSYATAFEFDNVKSYNETIREVTITNALGFGEDIGKARLNTPSIVKVGKGYQRVAEFEIVSYKDYDDILKQFSFKDLNTNKEIERKIDVKHLTYETVNVNDYKQVCSIVENEIIDENNKTIKQKCENILVGTHEEIKKVWTEKLKTDLNKNEKITIGLFTNVQEGDYIDWVPTIYGKEINEWAVWTEELDVDLISYYKFDNNDLTDSVSSNDGTNSGTSNTMGIMLDGRDFERTESDYISVALSSDLALTGDDYTISLWMNPESWSVGSNRILCADDGDDNSGGWCVNYLTNSLSWTANSGADNTWSNIYSVPTGSWTHLVYVFEKGAQRRVYINGLNIANSTDYDFNLANDGDDPMQFGRIPVYGQYFDGILDEVGIWNRSLSNAEVIYLYNQEPVINLNSPENLSSEDNNQVDFSCTVIAVLVNVTNMSLWTNETGSWAVRNSTTGINDNNYSESFTRTLTDGSYIWNCRACDYDDDCAFSNENRTIIIDTVEPNITLNNGSGTTFYGSLSINHSINFTVTDTNFDSCWVEYNSSNRSVACSNGTLANYSFELVQGLFDATVYANDTAGNVESLDVSWDYIFFENSTAYDTIVYETDYKNFGINVSTDLNILTAFGTLIYNGTSYASIGDCSSGLCVFSRSIDIPLVINGESENKTFNWNLSLFNGSTNYVLETAPFQQNTSKIHLEECNATFTTETLNFTAYNEVNLSRINPFYFAGTFETWLGRGTVTRNNSFFNSSTDDITLCITPALRIQRANALIEYDVDNETYVQRDYSLANESITNVSIDKYLYLLPSDERTSFIIYVQDLKLSPVADAYVHIQRYYPSDGTYKTVQIGKTDSNGETIGFYETETVDYRHIIIKDGVTLLTTDKQKVVGKTTPYTLTFTVGDALDNAWSSYEKPSNIASTLTYNETLGIVTFTYVDSSALTEFGNLLIVKDSNSNSTQIVKCNETTYQIAGTLSCNVSTYSGTLTAYGSLDNVVIDLLSFRLTDARDIMGNEGVLLGFFILLTAGMGFLWNPSAGIVGLNAGVIFINMIGFFTISPVFIFGMIAVSVILLILMKT